AVLERVCLGQFPRPRQVDASVPAALEAVCLRAMARKPGERYAGAKELAADIERWLADEPVAAYPEPVAVRAGRLVRRHQKLTVGVGVLLLTGVIALLVSNVLIGRAEREAATALQKAQQSQRETEAALAGEKQARRERMDALIGQLRTASPEAVPG